MDFSGSHIMDVPHHVASWRTTKCFADPCLAAKNSQITPRLCVVRCRVGGIELQPYLKAESQGSWALNDPTNTPVGSIGEGGET